MAEQGPQASDDEGLSVRVMRAVRVLVAAQLEAAQREARTDLQRLGAGLALIGVAIAFVFLAAIVLQAAAVAFVQARFGTTVLTALVVVAGADLLIAAVLALVARAKLAPPLMVETRAMVKRATDAIRGS
jgi:hypothetical protein